MFRKLLLFFAVLLLIPASVAFAYGHINHERADFVPGEILVEFSDAATLELLGVKDLEKHFRTSRNLFNARENSRLNRLFNKRYIESIEPVFKKRFAETQESKFRSGRTNLSLQELEARVINYKRERRNKALIDPREMVPLSNSFKVTLNERYDPYTEHFARYLNRYPGVNGAGVNLYLRSSLAPTDAANTNYNQQWGLKNDGSIVAAAVAGADIGAEAAWDKTVGSSDVIVAVLDTGVDPHPEYVGRLLEGENFVTGGSVKGNVDEVGHGTQVAGIIASDGADGTGMAGVCWNCTILPVRVLSSNSSTSGGVDGNLADVAVGVTYASEYADTEGYTGGTVINLSVQSEGDPGVNPLNKAINDAEKFWNVLVVSSRGNYENGYSTPTQKSFPGYHPKALSVGAMDPCNQRKDKSTACDGNADWGSRYEIAGSTAASAEGGLDFVAPGAKIFTTQKGGSGYVNVRGTSFATPHVTGIIALMLSMDSSLTPIEIRQILRDSAVDIEAPGWDNETGYGRVSAEAALNMLCVQKPGLAACAGAPDPEADLSVSVSAPAEALTNESVTYSLQISNSGPDSATGLQLQIEDLDSINESLDSVVAGGADVTASCTTNASITTCSLDDLAVDTVNVDVNITALEAGNLNYKFTVSSEDNDPDGSNNVAQAGVTINDPVPTADLAASASGTGSILVGENIVYTIDATNNGPDTAEGVAINFTYPTLSHLVNHIEVAGQSLVCNDNGTYMQCVLGTLSASETKQVDISIMALEQGQFDSSFELTTNTLDEDLNNNTDALSTTVAPVPIPEADLDLSASGTAQVQVGQEIVYQVHVNNHGPDAADNAELYINYPNLAYTLNYKTIDGQNLTCANEGTPSETCYLGETVGDVDKMSAGQSHVIEISITALAEGQYNTSFELLGDTVDPNSDNNNANVSTFVEAVPVPKADLSIQHLSVENFEVSYMHTLKVTNNGPDATSSNTFVYTPDHGFSLQSITANGQDIVDSCEVDANVTCELGAMEAAASQNIVISIISSEDKDTSSTFTISSDLDDPDEGNNSVSVAVMVSAAPYVPITATTHVYSGDAFDGSVDGSGGAYIKWPHIEGIGVDFDKYHLRFKKAAVSSFDGILYAKSYVSWNYYNWVGLTPGDIWSFQIVPVKDNDPTLPSYHKDKWTEVGQASNIVQCTISDNESTNAITCVSID